MPSKSKAQAKMMTAVCKSPSFRQKVGISKKIGCEFHKADKGKWHEDINIDERDRNGALEMSDKQLDEKLKFGKAKEEIEDSSPDIARLMKMAGIQKKLDDDIEDGKLDLRGILTGVASGDIDISEADERLKELAGITQIRKGSIGSSFEAEQDRTSLIQEIERQLKERDKHLVEDNLSDKIKAMSDARLQKLVDDMEDEEVSASAALQYRAARAELKRRQKHLAEDSENYLAARDKAIKNAMGKDENVDENKEANKAEENTVYCSSCGGEFKRDNKNGFSHCKDHKGMKNYDLDEGRKRDIDGDGDVDSDDWKAARNKAIKKSMKEKDEFVDEAMIPTVHGKGFSPDKIRQMYKDALTSGETEKANMFKTVYKQRTGEELNEVAPKGWEKTVKGMKKHKDDIKNPWALAHHMKKKGYKPSEGVDEGDIVQGPWGDTVRDNVPERTRPSHAAIMNMFYKYTGSHVEKDYIPVIMDKMSHRLSDEYGISKREAFDLIAVSLDTEHPDWVVSSEELEREEIAHHPMSEEEIDRYIDDETGESMFHNGMKVVLSDGGEGGEVFTLSQWDGNRGWIGDRQGRGWYVRGYQIKPASHDPYENANPNFSVMSEEEIEREYFRELDTFKKESLSRYMVEMIVDEMKKGKTTEEISEELSFDIDEVSYIVEFAMRRATEAKQVGGQWGKERASDREDRWINRIDRDDMGNIRSKKTKQRNPDKYDKLARKHGLSK